MRGREKRHRMYRYAKEREPNDSLINFVIYVCHFFCLDNQWRQWL